MHTALPHADLLAGFKGPTSKRRGGNIGEGRGICVIGLRGRLDDQHLLVGLFMQDYTSLCVQRLRLVPHSDRQTDSSLDSLYEELSEMS